MPYRRTFAAVYPVPVATHARLCRTKSPPVRDRVTPELNRTAPILCEVIRPATSGVVNVCGTFANTLWPARADIRYRGWRQPMQTGASSRSRQADIMRTCSFVDPSQGRARSQELRKGCVRDLNGACQDR
ncbi:hypothetical protein C8Q72DRAFT_798536 [Fomitopsis betulina]|nr:hypothetical protein C8Q72DRAFT_798536 [Fomitopsis betulina]